MTRHFNEQAYAQLKKDCPTWPADKAAEYRSAGLWEGLTLGDMLADRAARFGEKVAVVSGETRLSYSALYEQAGKLTAGLLQLGVQPTDRVVVQMTNRYEFFTVIFALFRIGALPVFALPLHRLSEIRYLCEFSEAKAYVIPDTDAGFDYRGLAAQVQEQVPTLKHVLVAGEPGAFLSLEQLAEAGAGVGAREGAGAEAGAEAREGAWTKASVEAGAEAGEGAGGGARAKARFEAGAEAREGAGTGVEVGDQQEQLRWPLVNSSDVAFLQLSGGSTGLPKLIPRTHDDYMYSFRRSNEICGITERSVYMAALPVAHNFPLSSPGVLGTLYAGGTIVLAARPSPDDAFPLIAKERVTITALVPPLALVWMEAAAQRRPDLSSLQVLQVGGAKFSAEAAGRVRQVLGCQLQQVYGMAEGLVNYTRLDDAEEIIVNTQGRPMSDWDEVRVVDENDAEVAPGEVGELLTRGPYTIRGYYKAEAHNAKAFTSDGFYRTGDLVKVDEQGYVTVDGRAKDQINRGGDKIAAEEVENHLLAHPAVFDAALVAMPDAFLGERSCAFIILREGAAATGPELKTFLRGRGLSAYKIPDRIEFTDAFPQTNVGKVSKKALRERLLTPTNS
ncbi:(2,3-dihydroxybenzoyl)adenylate synthase [Paenibacillus whitsoniae]|uniref:2,3-dihydroxybenzoate-AMP ligase n=1 Tax=Paenibacillus whitsoniae TaxID=2496558 RepID=A0A430J8X3_9BACL|nr:AMP-binding protein [Paenibacillus whitsoniae]RTE06430.1 2,3-dihydroxybenzoate-AMP ligase [Paenibacillus whitsoniae]